MITCDVFKFLTKRKRIFLIIVMFSLFIYISSEFLQKDVLTTKLSLVKTIISSKQSSNVQENLEASADMTRVIPITKDLYDSGYSNPNSELCPDMGDDLLVLIMVTSAPDHFEQRQSVRESWSTFVNRSDIAIAFIIGSTLNQTYEEILEHENFIHNDLIRSKSFDTYKNLTLKTLAILEWTITYCPNTRFLIKTDDDVFIHMRRLLRFIEEHTKDSNIIFGYVAENWPPVRDPKSKWYLPKESFESSILPTFIRGAIQLLTRDIIDDLYFTALDTPFVWLEDVFITGVVVKKLGIFQKWIGEVVLNNKTVYSNPCQLNEITAIFEVKPQDMIEYWRILENSDDFNICSND